VLRIIAIRGLRSQRQSIMALVLEVILEDTSVDQLKACRLPAIGEKKPASAIKTAFAVAAKVSEGT